MHWLYKDFRPYCEKAGIDLLKDDFRFIEKSLTKVPSNRHREVMRDYVRIWLHTVKENKNAVQAQNLARRNANIYLREQMT